MTHILMLGAWQLLLVAAGIVGITIFALVDILRSDFTGNNKIVWVLVVLLTNFLGAILYFMIGRQQKTSVSK